MSTHDDEAETGISDDRLPEDLRPTDDNPLAKPLTDEDDPKPPEELDVLGGKTPEESEQSDTDDADDAGTDQDAGKDQGGPHSEG